MSTTTQSEIRLKSARRARDGHEPARGGRRVRQTNEDKLPTESQGQMIRGYREKEIALDTEIDRR
jgi:hypothetical protein